MTLLAALYLLIAKVAPYQRLARWAMIGYTTLTLLLWMAIGMWTLVGSFWPPLWPTTPAPKCELHLPGWAWEDAADDLDTQASQGPPQPTVCPCPRSLHLARDASQVRHRCAC